MEKSITIIHKKLELVDNKQLTIYDIGIKHMITDDSVLLCNRMPLA